MSRAGERFDGALGRGEAVRIFTGAPVPDGADAILIQENAERDGDDDPRARSRRGRAQSSAAPGSTSRAGDMLLRAGPRARRRARSRSPPRWAMRALPVRRRPRVAILANGDELVPPGATPGPDQIVSSNGVGLAALVRETRRRSRSTSASRRTGATAIAAIVERAAGADILVVVGGASVGDHDLVQAALTDAGMALDFWKIAMRPGKPLMVGRLGGMRVLGLPGNPVSAFVCADALPEAADPRHARPADRTPRSSPRDARRADAGERRPPGLCARQLAGDGRRARRDALRRAGFLDAGDACGRRRADRPRRSAPCRRGRRATFPCSSSDA